MRIKIWLRRIAFVAAGLGTVIALAVVVENLRGKRAFLAYQDELAALGESLNWRDLVPPPVPAEENFAATPLLAPLHDYARDPKTRQIVFKQPGHGDRLKDLFNWRDYRATQTWRRAELSDLADWQRQLRATTNSPRPRVRELQARPPGPPAEDLLFLLAPQTAELDELRSAARRPHSVFPLHYEESVSVLLPELAILRGFAGAFQTRALAQLALGRTDEAAADVEACLGMSDALRSEAILISGLVRLATLELAVQPLWEGMARQQWAPAQLEGFQSRLARINLVEEMARNLRGERTLSIQAVALLSQNPAGFASSDAGVPSAVFRVFPSGWVYQNQASIARAFQELVLPTYHPAERRVDLARAQQLQPEYQRRFRRNHPYTVFARLLIPAVDRVATRVVRSQATLDLAVVACALERCRLQTGAYPDALDALPPRFLDRLPLDAVTREALHYRRTPEGRFVLYSTGLDRYDDGGAVLTDKRGNVDWEATGADWVWRYPAP